MSSDEMTWAQSLAILIAFVIIWYQNFRQNRQFQHNGGSSLWDKISKRFNLLDQRLDRMEGRLTDHLNDSDEIVKALKKVDEDIIVKLREKGIL